MRAALFAVALGLTGDELIIESRRWSAPIALPAIQSTKLRG